MNLCMFIYGFVKDKNIFYVSVYARFVRKLNSSLTLGLMNYIFIYFCNPSVKVIVQVKLIKHHDFILFFYSTELQPQDHSNNLIKLLQHFRFDLISLYFYITAVKWQLRIRPCSRKWKSSENSTKPDIF